MSQAPRVIDDPHEGPPLRDVERSAPSDPSSGREAYVFVVNQHSERFEQLPYSVALSWRRDVDADIVIYAMYDAIEPLRTASLADNEELRELVEDLERSGVAIFACGFCSRACELGADDYPPSIRIANRTILHDLLSTRRALYW